MKIIITLLISKLWSLIIKIKNLNNFIKIKIVQKSSESLNNIQMILYNLKYLNTSYLIIYLKNLSCKAILLLIYLFVLLVYFYILYLIYIKAYEQIIMNTMNTMNLIKIDLNLLYLKELYDSYDTAYGGSGALHLNQCEIIQKLHEINTLNYEYIKNINLINWSPIWPNLDLILNKNGWHKFNQKGGIKVRFGLIIFNYYFNLFKSGLFILVPDGCILKYLREV